MLSVLHHVIVCLGLAIEGVAISSGEGLAALLAALALVSSRLANQLWSNAK
jgi:hypothetical protein